MGTIWETQMRLKWDQCGALLGHTWASPFWTQTETIWGAQVGQIRGESGALLGPAWATSLCNQMDAI